MSDIGKMEQQVKDLQQKIKAQKKTESDAKKMALGEGVQRAIKAGDLQWHNLKPILQKHIKSERQRALLDLGKKEPEKMEHDGLL